MTPASVWNALTPDEQRAAMALLRCSDMRATPVLMRLRYQSRAAALANREVTTPGTARLAFAKWCVGQGQLSESVDLYMPPGDSPMDHVDGAL